MITEVWIWLECLKERFRSASERYVAMTVVKYFRKLLEFIEHVERLNRDHAPDEVPYQVHIRFFRLWKSFFSIFFQIFFNSINFENKQNQKKRLCVFYDARIVRLLRRPDHDLTR
jgi:hypothetical protein